MLNKQQIYNIEFNINLCNDIITIKVVDSINNIIIIESKLNNKGEFIIEFLSYTIKHEELIQFLIDYNYVEFISQLNYNYLLKLKSHLITKLISSRVILYSYV